MGNSKFDEAIIEAVIEECDDIRSAENHVFSKRFEKKLRRIINRKERSYRTLIYTVAKRAACIAVIVIAVLTTSLNVKSEREGVYEFIVTPGDGEMSVLEIAPEDWADAPQTLEEHYEVTYGLDGYTEKVWDNDDYGFAAEYWNGEKMVDFWQDPLYGTMALNTEDAVVYDIKIHGYDGVCYIDNHDYSVICWNNGRYVFSMSANPEANISLEEIIKMAESVKVKEE